MTYKWSNCLIEATKEFLRNPLHTKVYRKGSWKLIWRKHQFPHFYWYSKKDQKYYHFNAKYSDEPFLYQLWFRGYIDEFYYHK
jgi:hypothetical protein